MKNLTPVIFFLIAYNQRVFSRRLKDVTDDNIVSYAEIDFPKPYWTSDGHFPDVKQSWGSVHFNTADGTGDNQGFIFSDEDSYETSKSSPTSVTTQLRIRQCIAACQPTSGYQHVCGTDGITYHNLEQLQCFMECGIDVRIRQLSPCPGWGSTARPRTTPSTTTPSNLQTCMSKCPSTPEYNPVCGSDRVTYNNHGKLMCAQWCGKDVQVVRRSPCPKPVSTDAPDISTTTTPRSTTLSSSVRSCMTSCTSTPDYKPVCGTNNQTYFNLSRLQCARNCGVDVTVLKSVPCYVQENPNTALTANNENDDDDFDIDIRTQKVA